MRSRAIPARKREPLRRPGWEFFCKICANEFEADWTQDEPVTCPKCGTAFDTAWQLNAAGDLVGPWLSNRIRDDKGGS
jgi:hypothetical protein